MDKSGSVSANEVVETLELMQLIASGDGVDPILIAKGIFRIFDLDGDDKIELSELENIVAELLDLTYSVLSQVMNHLGASVAEEPLNEAVRLFFEQLNVSDNSEDKTYAICDIVLALRQLWSRSDLADGVRVFLEAITELISLPELQSVSLVIEQQYTVFFDKLSAANLRNCCLDIPQFTSIARDCIIEVLESLFKTADIVENSIMEQLFESIKEFNFEHKGEQVFKEKKIVPGDEGFVLVKMKMLTAQTASKKLTRNIHVPLTFIHKIIRTAVKALHDSLIEGGTNTLLSSAALFLDPACTGNIMISDLLGLRDSVIALIDACRDGEEFNSRLEKTISAWLSLSAKHADDNLHLIQDETLMCSKAVTQIFINLMQETIKEIYSTMTAISSPTIKLVLNVKGQVLDADDKTLTFEDVTSFNSIFEWE